MTFVDTVNENVQESLIHKAVRQSCLVASGHANMNVCEAQWGHLIMGECRCAVALLWLEHVPSISLAIGPRQSHGKTLAMALPLMYF